MWAAAILYMALIFYLSSKPVPELTRMVPIIYRLKLVHMFEFGILSALFFLAVRETHGLSLAEASSFAIMAVLLYGSIDELHQTFVPMRTGKLIDIAANGIGAVIAQAGLIGHAAGAARARGRKANPYIRS